jgi:hypothetical protein
MDKYAGAKNLISELKLVHPKKNKQLKKENKSKIKNLNNIKHLLLFDFVGTSLNMFSALTKNIIF